MPAPLASRELIEVTLDDGSFDEWPSTARHAGDDASYAAELAAATGSTGLVEAVVTGRGLLEGRPVAVIVGEFAFLGGSIGIATAETIVRAVRRATDEGLPILAAPVSGGTRMQEGTLAFLQMVRISAAVSDHKRAGLAYLVYLRNPTTGGVFASWGTMGHITVAEPGALIGFLGPRVFRALHGEDFPAGVQTAENLFAHGIVDAVVAVRHLRALAATVLDILAPAEPVSAASPLDRTVASSAGFDDWRSVELSRHRARPGLRSLLRVAATQVVQLRGTGTGEADSTLTLALARFGGHGVVVLGQDRRSQTGEVALGPAALRLAVRGIRLAEDLGLPLVTVVDTPGAALSREAEEGGLAGEIGRCMVALLEAAVPTVSVILGQGTGGAALALVPCDLVLVAENGWLAPLPPEGASAIVYRDADHADSCARDQRVGSLHLAEDGIADAVIAEPLPAHADADAFAARTGVAVEGALDILVRRNTQERLRQRRRRYDLLGSSRLAP